MKRKITFLLALLTSLAVSVTAVANSQLTVFSGGEELSNNFPINMVYLSEVGTRTQLLYPASALVEMTEEPINSMTFYLVNEGVTVDGGLVRFSVAETTRESMIGGYIDEGLTTVATISLTPGVTELVVTFDTPFVYHGGNLLLETYVEQMTDDSEDLFEGMRPDNYNAMTRSELAKFLPKTTFDYGVNEDYAAKVVPVELTFKEIRAEREDTLTTVIKNIGQRGFTPTFSVEAPFFVDLEAGEIAPGETLELPVRFAPMEAGSYDGTLNINCGPAGTLQVALHGNAMQAAVDLLIKGDSIDYASYVPIYGAEIDIVGTQGQVIYPESLLSSMKDRDILSLKFFTYGTIQMNGGTIQLSLKEAKREAFVEPVVESTGLTAVATVVPEYGGIDLEFIFDEPYHYHGGNLLVDCTVIEPGITNYRQTFFYGTPVEYNCGVFNTVWYADIFDTEFVPFLPMISFSYSKSASDILRGDVNHDKSVTIADVTALINILLRGAEAPEEANCNLDSVVNISDVTALINYLLRGSW